MTMPASVDNVLPFIKPGWVGVEIGVQWGISSVALLRHGVRFLYLVDPWEKYEGYSSVQGPHWDRIEEENYQETRSRLREYDDGRHFAILRMKSLLAVELVPAVDFCFVDGNHAYRWVMEDLRHYWPKIRFGGILCGHDYALEGPCEVRDAVTTFARVHGLRVELCPPCWVIRNE